MKLQLKDILPNPFRDLVRNPLNVEKITELINSILSTGFWDNVVVRLNTDGKYELAYGHHRLAAAIKAGLTEADFIVKKLDDAMMLQIMARENRETYRYCVLALLESVRGTVQALADERIPSFVIDPKTRKDLLRHAPSFIPGESSSDYLSDHPYTTLCIGIFLGYTLDNKGGVESDRSVVAALNALHLIQIGKMTEDQIKDWNVSQLLVNTRDILKRVTEERIRHADTQAEVNKVMTEKRALEAENKAKTAEALAKREELTRQEREARKEENIKDAKRLAEERKALADAEKERTAKVKIALPAFEARVEKIKEQSAAVSKEKSKNRATDQNFATALFNAKKVYSEGNAYGADLKVIKAKGDVNQREILRQALLNAGDWYHEQANYFLPLAVRKEAN